MIELDILQFTEEADWNIGYVRKEYSGHLYYGSAIESADSCGTCDGAKCSVCKEIVTNDILEFSCPCDRLERYLMAAGAPEDVAMEFTYSDTVGSMYKGYYLHWPTCEDLKREKPEMYKKLTTMDPEIYAEILKEIPNYKIYGEMKDAILAKHGITEYDSFLEKQLELFWRMNGETHDIFKMPDERFTVGDLGSVDITGVGPNDWICYCIKEGVWQTGQVKSISESCLELYSGLVVDAKKLLTDVHKIEDFNAARYNGFKDNRLMRDRESHIFA